jgi:hypothetical protein
LDRPSSDRLTDRDDHPGRRVGELDDLHADAEDEPARYRPSEHHLGRFSNSGWPADHPQPRQRRHPRSPSSPFCLPSSSGGDHGVRAEQALDPRQGAAGALGGVGVTAH